MTEDEAKKMICPELSGPIAEPPDSDKTYFIVWIDCIASECHWWISEKHRAGHGHCGVVK